MRAIIGVVLVAACGGGSGSVAAVTVESARPACEQMCQHWIDCGNTETLAACTDRCATSVEGWAREDGLDQIGDCISMLSCEVDDDGCAAMIPALDAHTEWQSQCEAKLGTCPDFTIQVCSIDAFPWYRLIVPQVMDEMTACLDAATCDARLSCVDAVHETYHIDL